MSYLKLTEKDSVVSSEKVVRPAWYGETTTLSTFYTPNLNESDYYINVYKESPIANPYTQPQFSVTYGHVSGSGSIGSLQDSTYYTRIIYGQYRSLILQNENSLFDFGGSSGSSDGILVLSVARNCFKESLKPSGFNIKLKNGSTVLNLTDNSKDLSSPKYLASNRYYDIVSGSDGGMATGQSILNTSRGSYGFFFPDLGTIVFNPNALALSSGNKGVALSIASGTTTNVDNNAKRLYDLIVSGQSFKLSSEETVTSRYFFITAPSTDFNYTTNPSVIDENGNLIYSTLVDSPETFITTIGLYSDNNELLGVAKLSSPVKKNFIQQLLFTVKLSW